MLQRTLTKRRRAQWSPWTFLVRNLASFVPPIALPWSSTPRRAASITTTRTPSSPRHSPMSRSPTTAKTQAPCDVGDSLVGATSTPSHPPSTLALTAQEAAIFQLLSRVRVEEKLEGLTLRVAGGWVRDKVLGRAMTNVDIDIALDTLLGREFAEIVNKWMAEQEMEKASMGVIPRNPDQSKHLETATMRVLGVWLDLVNLRTETYSHDSRIPDMAIGTPLEDAMRRDLTINSLFYNINTGIVEDLTGHGLNDIRAGIVRTPLPPLTTLLDDPLRALRAIRFASRLNFSFDTALFEACKHPEVHYALDAKVSRERVASELDGIMKSDRPTHAIGLLVELGLHPIVFRVPVEDSAYASEKRPPTDFPAASLGALLNLEALWNAADDGAAHSPLLRRLATQPLDTRIPTYAAALIHLAGVESRQGRRKRPGPLVQAILGEELRMSSKDVAEIVGVHNAALNFRKLANSPERLDRLSAGLAIRSAGPRWRTALQVTLVGEMPPAKVSGSHARGVDKKHRVLDPAHMHLVEKYAVFMSELDKFKLEGVWDTKPCINGNEILSILPKLKKGKIVGDIIQRQIEWMIENPGCGKREAKEWLVSTYSEMR